MHRWEISKKKIKISCVFETWCFLNFLHVRGFFHPKIESQRGFVLGELNVRFWELQIWPETSLAGVSRFFYFGGQGLYRWAFVGFNGGKTPTTRETKKTAMTRFGISGSLFHVPPLNQNVLSYIQPTPNWNRPKKKKKNWEGFLFAARVPEKWLSKQIPTPEIQQVGGGSKFQAGGFWGVLGDSYESAWEACQCLEYFLLWKIKLANGGYVCRKLKVLGKCYLKAILLGKYNARPPGFGGENLFC